jgi:pimeloyl-ACP methyl ester carboxylesterase
VDVVACLFARLTGRAVDGGQTVRDGRVLRWTRISGGGGPDAPVVVLEAGMGEPTPTWAPALAAGLADLATVVAYDRAGIGLSGPAYGDYSGRTQLADLIALIEDVGRPPCVLVGHSLGGWLAQALAFQRPDLLAGLVLIDPSHEAVYRHIPEDLLEAMNGAIADYKDMPAADFVATRAGGWREEAAKISESDEDRALIIEAWQADFAADDRVHTIYAEEMAAQRDQPWAEQLRATCALPKLPSVVLSATTGMPLDMRTLFTGLQREIAAGLGAEHASVADSGHYIHRDQPKAVIGAVSRAIASRGRDVS